MSPGRSLGEFARDIKLEHSLFALPFAFVGALAPIYRGTGVVSAATIALILLAMFFARTAAMGFNRWLDRDFDLANPRTSGRAIPSGRIASRTVLVYSLVAAACFLATAFAINSLAGWLSPVALAVILGYSTAKRWTNWTHLLLGLSLALAPAGGWIAVSGIFDPAMLALVLGVTLWVAGFDVLYALQDLEFDREKRLKSVPARYGAEFSRRLAAGFHLAAVFAFLVFGESISLGSGWRISVLAVGIMLAVENALARDPGRIPAAFFNINAAIGFILLAGFVHDGVRRGVF